ncbi:MAG: hypothetical protein QOF46_387 [Paraburkholderia sp.]|jgi:hypothetical protein|nr:hypothetical protein [Paraburkholderia sp.]
MSVAGQSPLDVYNCCRWPQWVLLDIAGGRETEPKLRLPTQWKSTMRLPNGSFRVGSVPTFCVGRFFAQARIFRVQPGIHEQLEIFAAINLPDFATEAEAIAFSNKWAVAWINENILEITAT